MTAQTYAQSQVSLDIDEHLFDCPICLDLLCEPVALQCGHTYCQHCITQFIASQTTSPKSYSSPSSSSCLCPSCKAMIANAYNGFVVCYTLRDFLKAQFVALYRQRLNDTQHDRNHWNAVLLALKRQKERERKSLNKCCGLRRLQRWLVYQYRALFDPNLHRSLLSFMTAWLLLYLFLLCILTPILLPLTLHFQLHSWHDLCSLLGLAHLPQFAVSASPVLQVLGQSILQFFGLIAPFHTATATAVARAYLPQHYVPQSQFVLPYHAIGDIFTAQTTDWYYKPVFEHWTSRDLKLFARKHEMPSTCLERLCYTDAIMQYLKDAEWQALAQSDEPVSIDILKQYLNHYNIDFSECRNSIWQNDYKCFAKKAASIKLVNDVYYNKEYLLSRNAPDAHKDSLRGRGEKTQQKKPKRMRAHAHKQGNSNAYRQRHMHERDTAQHRARHPRAPHFNSIDLDNIPFDLFSEAY